MEISEKVWYDEMKYWEGGTTVPADFLHKICFAIISGITEFLPVSPRPHQMIYEVMTGYTHTDSMLDLAIHLGCLVALLVCCAERIRRFTRERRLARNTAHRRNRHVNMVAVMDAKILRMAMIPMVLSLLFYRWAEKLVGGVVSLAVVLVINGLIIALPRILPQGNKDGRNLSLFDGLLIGLSGALGAIPGLSRMGCILTGGSSRGADRSYVLDMALMLSIPVLLVLVVMDIYAVIVAKAALTLLGALLYVLSAALAFGGSYLAIVLMRYLSMKIGFVLFCYYSWGMALLSFILYLII